MKVSENVCAPLPWNVSLVIRITLYAAGGPRSRRVKRVGGFALSFLAR